jgi:predicted DCC family thiol-disulfide oxidoreductase YuxK
MGLTVVYDQDCGVCGATANWLVRRDPSIKLVGNGAETLPEGVAREETGETVFVVDEATGAQGKRAEAIAKLLRGLPGWRSVGYRLLGVLMSLPVVRWFARIGYDNFARRRHRVSAALGMGVCKVPARPGKV